MHPGVERPAKQKPVAARVPRLDPKGQAEEALQLAARERLERLADSKLKPDPVHS
jgi:hypothetical protein